MSAKQGHLHRCRDGHSWEHAGPAGRCQVPEYASELWGRYTSVEHCPVCTRREDLVDRGAHGHRCPTCKGEWAHEGRCLEPPETRCPWCAAPGGEAGVSGRRRGPHTHQCPRCTRLWEHREACVAPHRAVLPGCPGCRDPAQRFAARLAADVPAAGDIVLPGFRPGRTRRALVAGVVALGGLALGAVVGVVLWSGSGDREGVRAPAPAPRVATAPAPTAPPAAAPTPAQSAAASTPAPETTRPVVPSTPTPEPARATPPPAPTPTPPAARPTEPALPSPATPSQPPPVPSAVPPATPRVAAPPPPSSAAPAKPGPGAKPAAPGLAPRPTGEASAPGGLPASRAAAPAASPSTAERLVESCATPSTASVLVSIESGQVLGPWIGIEVDRSVSPTRCLLVIRRPDETRWVIDARRVRVRPAE